MRSELITLLLFVLGFINRNTGCCHTRRYRNRSYPRTNKRGFFDKFSSLFIEIFFYLFHQCSPSLVQGVNFKLSIVIRSASKNIHSPMQ